jgi:hypothetical protein
LITLADKAGDPARPSLDQTLRTAKEADMKKPWITGEDLIKELSIRHDYLLDLLLEGKLSAYNHLHTLLSKDHIERSICMALGYRDELIDSFLFKTQEIEQLKKDTSEYKEFDGVPVFYFFKKGDYWFIGNDKDKTSPLNKKKGFDHIHFLLKHEGIENSALTVFYDGSIPENLNTQTSYQPKNDATSIKEYNDALSKLEEDLSEETDQNKREDLSENIKTLKNIMNSSKNNLNSDSEKVRQAVTKNISTALERLHKERPYLKKILNNKNLFTGNQCSYQGASTFKWILDPE